MGIKFANKNVYLQNQFIYFKIKILQDKNYLDKLSRKLKYKDIKFVNKNVYSQNQFIYFKIKILQDKNYFR
jgi:hypothetical protein